MQFARSLKREHSVIQVLRFGIVGTLLFIIDAGLFASLLKLELPAVAARILAISMTVFASWLANRSWTFKEQHGNKPPSIAEFAKFAGTQAIGASVNGLASLAAYQLPAVVALGPWAAVAIGSIAGLSINFAGAKLLVFRGSK